MAECVSHKSNIKSRKDHKCFGCHAIIPKGSTSDVTVCVEDGEIYSVRLCKECEVTEVKLKGEEWFQGDLGEYRREEEQEKERQIDHEARCYIESKAW